MPVSPKRNTSALIPVPPLSPALTRMSPPNPSDPSPSFGASRTLRDAASTGHHVALPDQSAATQGDSAQPSTTVPLVERSIDPCEPTFDRSAEYKRELRHRLKKRPYNREFYQGALPAIQMTLSPPAIISWMLLSAIIAVALGVVIVLESDKIYEQRVSYGTINNYIYPRDEAARNLSLANGGITFDIDGATHVQGWATTVTFNVSRHVDPPIYLSYTVDGFIQNYRQYSQSLNDLQLKGRSLKVSDLVKCRPLRAPGELQDEQLTRNAITVEGQNMLYGDMMYFPAGVVSWSMFNDSISLYRTEDSTNVSLICNASDFTPTGDRVSLTAEQNPCTKNGIAWPSDRNFRYIAPAEQIETINHWTGRGRANTSDEYLKRGWYFREPGHKVPDPKDEDLMVWNRLSGFPRFRKLHRVIHTPLEPGLHELRVLEFFDVASFKGNKGVLLRSGSWLGAQNYTLGIIFAAGGAVCLLLAIALFIRDHVRTLPAAEEEEEPEETNEEVNEEEATSTPSTEVDRAAQV